MTVTVRALPLDLTMAERARIRACSVSGSKITLGLDGGDEIEFRAVTHEELATAVNHLGALVAEAEKP